MQVFQFNIKAKTTSVLLVVILSLVHMLQMTECVLAQKTKEEKQLEEKKKNEEERKRKEAQAREKDVKKYKTLLDFGLDLYAANQEFREMVDKAYSDLQSYHARQAYAINTGSRIVNTQRESRRYNQYEEEYNANLDQVLHPYRVLYDNPWAQEYINRVGQSLVPEDSDKLFAFKIIYDPIPYAFTLSTGTILISTGMISILDNESQLAYVLAHEIAHVYKDHWKAKVIMELSEQEYNRQQAERIKKKAIIFGLIGAAAGTAIGAATGNDPTESLNLGAVAGAGIGAIIGYVKSRNLGLDWDRVQENEADELALRILIKKSYDVKQVQVLYSDLRQFSNADARMQLGFFGNRNRIQERIEYTNQILTGNLSQSYQDLLKSGRLIGDTPEFKLVMAELKRDNGIEAINYDMFGIARRNLMQAVSLRSNDPLAAFYYGLVLKIVGRTKEEQDTAREYLLNAIRLDTRHQIPAAQLERALMSMSIRDAAAQKETVSALQQYVLDYQAAVERKKQESENLPPNMTLIYDYMRLLGETKWTPPVRPLSAAQIIVDARDGTNTTPVVSPPTPPPSKRSTSTASPRRYPK